MWRCPWRAAQTHWFPTGTINQYCPLDLSFLFRYKESIIASEKCALCPFYLSMIQVVVNQTSTGPPPYRDPPYSVWWPNRTSHTLEKCTGSLGTWHHHKERLWRNWWVGRVCGVYIEARGAPPVPLGVCSWRLTRGNPMA